MEFSRAGLTIDEKPWIQALERAEGYLKLSNGARSPVGLTTSGGMAQPHSSRRSILPAARSAPSITATSPTASELITSILS